MSDSELHWYCQKEIRSLLYQFPYENVALDDKQLGGYSSKRALYEFCFCQPWYLFMCCWCFFWKYLRTCFFHIYQIYVLGMGLQICFSMFAHIISLWEKIGHYWGKSGSLFGHTFVVHLRLGIVMPVLARYLKKEHLVISMKRKRTFSWHKEPIWFFLSFMLEFCDFE